MLKDSIYQGPPYHLVCPSNLSLRFIFISLFLILSGIFSIYLFVNNSIKGFAEFTYSSITIRSNSLGFY